MKTLLFLSFILANTLDTGSWRTKEDKALNKIGKLTRLISEIIFYLAHYRIVY